MNPFTTWLMGLAPSTPKPMSAKEIRMDVAHRMIRHTQYECLCGNSGEANTGMAVVHHGTTSWLCPECGLRGLVWSRYHYWLGAEARTPMDWEDAP